jgi:hypothetical protein
MPLGDKWKLLLLENTDSMEKNGVLRRTNCVLFLRKCDHAERVKSLPACLSSQGGRIPEQRNF